MHFLLFEISKIKNLLLEIHPPPHTHKKGELGIFIAFLGHLSQNFQNVF